jgi:HK97 family phage prohead protease
MPDSTTYISGDHKVADFKMFTDVLKAAGESDDGMLRIKGIASSTVRDRHGDRMERTALKDMERAANDNLTIFVNHSYNVPEDVVGSAEKAVLKRRSGETDEDGNPLYDLELSVLMDSGNPRAVKTYEAIQRGVKLGMSIGAMIPKGGAKYDEENNSFIIHHVDLLETSVVSIPANPRSWVGGAVKALRNDPDKLENPEEYRKSLAEAADIDPAFLNKDASEEVDEDDPSVDHEVDDSDAEVTEQSETPDITADEDVAEATESAEPTSQEASDDADPGTEDGADPESVQEAADPDPEVELDLSLLEGVQEEIADLVTSINTQMVKAVEDLETEKRLRLEAEGQRDDAVKAMSELIPQVKSIIDLIAKTPSGRKTRTFAQAKGSFDHLTGIYGEGFLKQLQQNRSE